MRTGVLGASAPSPGPPVPLPRGLLRVGRGRTPAGTRRSSHPCPPPTGSACAARCLQAVTWVFPARPVPSCSLLLWDQALCQQELQAQRTSPGTEEEVAARTKAAENAGAGGGAVFRSHQEPGLGTSVTAVSSSVMGWIVFHLMRMSKPHSPVRLYLETGPAGRRSRLNEVVRVGPCSHRISVPVERDPGPSSDSLSSPHPSCEDVESRPLSAGRKGGAVSPRTRWAVPPPQTRSLRAVRKMRLHLLKPPGLRHFVVAAQAE